MKHSTEPDVFVASATGNPVHTPNRNPAARSITPSGNKPITSSEKARKNSRMLISCACELKVTCIQGIAPWRRCFWEEARDREGQRHSRQDTAGETK